MKVLTPVKNLLSWIEIIKNWTDEIYFWIVSKDWQDKYNYTNILNRRDWNLANISSYSDAKKLINFARSNWVKSFVTLNNSPQIPDERQINEEIKNIISVNPDWLIVKDLFVADLIRKIDKNIEIHCSSLNQIINTSWIQLWIEKYNISRMILPRNVSVNEIRELATSFPDLEFEIFVKNDWCYNSDWICSSLHLEWLKEWIPYVCNRESRYKGKNNEYNDKYIEIYKKSLDCKICILSKLRDIKNIVSLKIVWREKPLNIILNDLKLVKNSVKFLKLSENSNEHMNFNINLYKKLLKKECSYKDCEIYNKYYEK